MTDNPIDREDIDRADIATDYLEQLPYPPYPVQEEALLTYFTDEEGVLLCAPTGTGKTLVAQGALYEALRTGQVAYYTTPLIALTEQKFAEMQAAAEKWGFSPEDIGLVTGHRRVNPDAKVLVVVAEILLNRLLGSGPEAFDDVCAVVMDEFHSIADRDRGIVWELTLGLLPEHVRLLLLSATVGNEQEFLLWLARSHGRRPKLVSETVRKVPLTHTWVGDRMLNELVQDMAEGEEEHRRTPALVFCFNRDECWSVAEQLKGLSLLPDAIRKDLLAELDEVDLKGGVGPKLRQILVRGVGVHHAGMLPKYRRLVEDLYERKLLAVCTCTETLAAGMNLPARSVVMTELLKGPFGAKKVVDASTAHQIFGRAGRPQFDDRGYVYALAHEDDVRIHRWQEKFDQIDENDKDPKMLAYKKKLKKKKPTRRDAVQYWNEDQYEKLVAAPATKLYSKGPLPWRLLAYLLGKSDDVDRLRDFVGKRFMDGPRHEAAKRKLRRMLLALWDAGLVELEPSPPRERNTPQPPQEVDDAESGAAGGVEEEEFGTGLIDDEPEEVAAESQQVAEAVAAPVGGGLLAGVSGLQQFLPEEDDDGKASAQDDGMADYAPQTAVAGAGIADLLHFRSIHPLYGRFLLGHLHLADDAERIQILESTLLLPGSVVKHVRVPWPDQMPPGRLQSERLDSQLVRMGLISADNLAAGGGEPDEDAEYEDPAAKRERLPELGRKLHILFESQYPLVDDVQVKPVWCVGELLADYAGDFDEYVRNKKLVKQEGIFYRHALRMILLCHEFHPLTPAGADRGEWTAWLDDLANRLTASCRAVDPESTDEKVEEAEARRDHVPLPFE